MRLASDGKPLLTHLKAVYEQTKRKPESLAAADEPAPVELAYIEVWFHELNRCRTGNGFGGLNRFSYTEIRSWAILTGRQLSPQEVEWLMMVDGIFIETITAKEGSDG
jgi:hypothetical protein